MKISEIVVKLTELKKEHGDVPVITSRDEEGNGFSPIEPDSFCQMLDEDETGVIGICLYPGRQFYDPQEAVSAPGKTVR